MAGIFSSAFNALSNAMGYAPAHNHNMPAMTLEHIDNVAKAVAQAVLNTIVSIRGMALGHTGPFTLEEVEGIKNSAVLAIQGLVQTEHFDPSKPRTQLDQALILARAAALLEELLEQQSKSYKASVTTQTQDEFEAEAVAAMNFGPQTSNPGAGWGGNSPTNEGNFATIDSNGNITNSLGQTIGQSTLNTTNVGSITDSGGNTIE